MNERLKQWAINHLKHKDLFYKNLIKIENNKEGFIAHFKNKKERFIIQENLHFKNIPKDENVCFVTFNNNKNFQTLFSEWKILVSFPKLKIIFVEKISNGKYWSIHPFTHDKISDKNTLKRGIKTLFESVKND